MKRIVIVAILGLFAMSSTVEACHGRRIRNRCGGGLFHHRRSCQACCQQETVCQTVPTCQQTMVYMPPQQMVYQTYAPQPMTYAAPQVVAQPQVPAKSTPQVIAPPQLPGKSAPQR